MTAGEIFKALKAVFPKPAYTLLSEVRNGTGFSRGPRTADALCVSNYPGRGLWLGGIEIKVYLGDWKRELANGDKAEAIQKYCHYWYIAAPEGLIPQNELPETWGLIEVGKKTKIVVKATKLEPKPIDMLLLASILRNVGESHVGKDFVEELADERAKKIAESQSYELKNLKESIAKFKEESGIDLGKDTFGWRHGNVGKAVKIVVDSLLPYQQDQLKALKKRAEEIIVACHRIDAAICRDNPTDAKPC